MTCWFVGDIQACYDELSRLLEKCRFDPACDSLHPVGDLIGRGPRPLATLRLLKSLGEAARPVLGNHDLHFLAVAHKLKHAKPADNYDTLLQAPDKDALVSWLLGQPLLRHYPEHKLIQVHAGISPQWDLATALRMAANTAAALRRQPVRFLEQMYGNAPDNWQQALTPQQQYRFTINSLTRMRFCRADLSLDLNCKSPPEQAPPSLQPWFHYWSLPDDYRVVFGHWAALMGRTGTPRAVALDTGCVWGNHLTIWDPLNNRFLSQKKSTKVG